MSFRRKTYDADLFGGSTGASEWGDTLDSQSQADKPAAPKRTGGNDWFDRDEESLFGDEGDKDRYLITYADLITLLLGLFIILYAISSVDTAKYQNMINLMGGIFGNVKSGKIGPENRKFDIRDKLGISLGLKSQLQEVIAANNLQDGVRLEENERGITIHIHDEILFAPAAADLNGSSRLILGKIASVLRSLPNDIRVEGHTDNIPIKSSGYASNWHLSVARALNTAYHLIDREKLPPEKVSIVGYAEYRPVSANSTPEGRAANRRVDIVILKTNQNKNENYN